MRVLEKLAYVVPARECESEFKSFSLGRVERIVGEGVAD
jgi:hypothetical protein